MGYWAKVLRGAWDKTIHPLGWDRKKVALALTAVGGVIAAGLHFGWVAMFESASGVFWVAFPPIFAAIILFVWGIIETQSKLYSDLATSTSSKIADLQAKINEFKNPTPDYVAWRHKERIDLRTAAFLWCKQVPGLSMSAQVSQQYQALCGAVQSGDLDFVAHYTTDYLRDAQKRSQQKNPSLDTEVTRTQLKAFAKKYNYDPVFLRDA